MRDPDLYERSVLCSSLQTGYDESVSDSIIPTTDARSRQLSFIHKNLL